MSALGRCARFCLSRLAHLPRTHILHQTQRNVAFAHLKPQVATVSFNIRRNYHVKEETSPFGPHRNKDPIGDLDIYLNRFGRVTTYNIDEAFKHFKKYGMANVHDGFKVLRFTGEPICDLNPTKRMDLTERAWKYIEESGFQLGSSAFNNLLLVYLENKHKFSPPDFLATMQEKGVKPNRVTYQLLLTAYCEEGDIENASHILEQMKEEGLETSDAVFNSLITGHFRAKDEEGASSILELMRQSGLEPTKETYSTLLHGYAELGDLESYKRIIAEADEIKVGLRPYHISDSILTAVVNGHEQVGFEILEILVSKEMRFFQDIKTILYQMVAQGYVETAFKIHKQLFPDGGGNYIIRTILHNLSIDEYEDIARDYISKMRASEVFDLIKYSYYCNRVDWALKVIEMAKDQGLEIRTHMVLPAYVQYTKDKNKEGLLHTYDVAIRTSTKQNFAIQHLLEHVIPPLQEAGETTEDIFTTLKARGVDDKVIDSACFWLLAGSDPVKAMEFGKDKSIFISNVDIYNWQNIQEHWQDYFKMMAKFGSNETGYMPVTEKLLHRVLETKVDTAEDVIRYFTSLDLKLRKDFVVKLKNQNLLDGVSSEAIQAFTRQQDEPRQMQDKRWGHIPNEMTVEELQVICERNPEDPGIKLKILSSYSRMGDLEKAEKLLSEVEADGIHITGTSVLNKLLMLYSYHQKNLSMSLKYLTMLETDHPDYGAYKINLIDVCSLLTDAGKFEDVLPHIQLYTDRHGDFLHNFPTYIRPFRMLAKNIGNKVEPKEALDFMDKIVEKGFLSPSALVNQFFDNLIQGYIERGDNDKIVEVMKQIHDRYDKVFSYHDVFSYFVEREDSDNLQKVTDIVHSAMGESITILNLIYVLVMQNKLPQARELSQTPQLRARMRVIESLCYKMIENEKITELKNMVDVCKDIYQVDRDVLYLSLMKGYKKIGYYKAAKDVLLKYEEDGILPSSGTLKYIADVLKSQGMEVDFYYPKEAEPEPEPASEIVSEDKETDNNTLQMDIEMFVNNTFKSPKALLNSERFQDEERLKEFLKEVWNRKKPGKSVGFSSLHNWLKSNGKVSVLKYLDEEVITEDFNHYAYGETVAERDSANIIDVLNLQIPEKRDRYINIKVLETLKTKNAPVYEKVVDLIKEQPAGKSAQNVWMHTFETDPEKATTMLQEAPDEMKANLDLRHIGVHLARKKNEEDALLKLLELGKKDYPDQVKSLYEYLIQLYARVSDIEKTRQILQQMKDEGLDTNVLNRNTRNHVKRLFNDYGDSPEASEIVSEDKENHDNNTLQMDLEMYANNKFKSIDAILNSERFQDEERLKEFLKEVWKRKKTSKSGLTRWLKSNGKDSVLKYLDEEVITDDFNHYKYGETVAERDSANIIDELNLQIPEKRDRYINIKVLETLKTKNAPVYEKVVDLIKEQPAGKSAQNLWRHTFETDPEKATTMLQEASEEMKANLDLRPTGEFLARNKNKEDVLLKLLELGKKDYPDQVKSLYEYLIQSYAGASDIEKTRQILQQMKDEGLDTNEFNKTTRNCVKKLFNDYGDSPKLDSTPKQDSLDTNRDSMYYDVQGAIQHRKDGTLEKYLEEIFDKEEYKDENKRMEFCGKVCFLKPKEVWYGVVKQFLMKRDDGSVLQYVAKKVPLTRTHDEALGVAMSNPSEIIEKLDLMDPDKLDEYVSLRMLCTLEEKAPDTLQRVLDLMKEKSSTNPVQIVNLWQYYFVTDQDKATQLLEDAPDTVKNSLGIRRCGAVLITQEKEDELFSLLDVARKYKPKEIHFVYESLLRLYAKQNNAEKATVLLDRMRNEGIEWYDVVNKKRKVYQQLKELGLDLPPKAEEIVSSNQETEDVVSNSSSDSSSSSDSDTESASQHV